MMSGSPPVIRVQGLWRFYGRRKKVEAVRNVSFEVNRGEIFGLIGPDGAGKTSVIQVLAGVLAAQEGSIFLSGIDVVADSEAVKSQIGYMPQGLGVNLYESLTVEENIEFFRDLRKLPDAIYQQNRNHLLNMTRLGPFVHRRAGNLSGGMRQKLALICTLIHLPDVILLDEPTTGVDPISRQEFWQIIRRLVQERSVTILLSTSYMDEAERCQRIALMHSGSIIEQGDPDDLKAKARGHFASFRAEPQIAALKVLQARDDVISTESFGNEIHICFEGDWKQIETALKSRQIEVLKMTSRGPSLEDFFLQLLSSGKQQKPSLHIAAPSDLQSAVSIQCESVTRKFADFVAVDDVSLRVERGEIFGLLGPNGAGKTTLIKMMCGLLEPNEGKIRVAGFDLKTEKKHVWTQIGYMSQHFSLYRDLTVRQNLRLYSDLYDVKHVNLSDWMSSLGLEAFTNRLTGDLPAGVRQRLSLLCAMLHRPPVLFLDEPTSGVDPVARRTFWDLISSFSRESQVTVLVSTHYMDEADHCDRLGLMNQGQLIAVDSPARLKERSEQHSGKLLTLHVPEFRLALDAILPDFPGAVLYGDVIHLRTPDPQSDQRKLISLLSRVGIQVLQFAQPPLSMDETFIDFIRSAETVHA